MGVVSTIGVLIAAAAVGGIAVLYGVEEQTMRRFLDDGEGNDDDDPLAGCTIEPVGCFTVRASGLRDPLSVAPLGRAVQPVCPAVPKRVAAVPAGWLRRGGVPKSTVRRGRLFGPRDHPCTDP